MLPKQLKGGSIGVDVFFVISGFVITRLLVTELDKSDSLRFSRFYERRFLRLMPALFAMCVLVGVISVADPHGVFRQQWVGAILASTYTMDIARAIQPAHGWVGTHLVAHTWSLGVEEQFYLLWPFLLIAFWKLLPRRWVLPAVAGLALIPTIERAIIWSPGLMGRIFNAPDTRADQLLIGCALAVAAHQWPVERLVRIGRAAGLLAWPAALALIVIAIRFPVNAATGTEAHVYYIVGFLVVAVLAGVVVTTLALNETHPLTRILGWAPLAWVGANLSYGLYVWHQPIYYVISASGISHDLRPVLKIVLSVLAALLSWRFIERPFLNMKSRRAVVTDAEVRVAEVPAGVLEPVS